MYNLRSSPLHKRGSLSRSKHANPRLAAAIAFTSGYPFPRPKPTSLDNSERDNESNGGYCSHYCVSYGKGTLINVLVSNNYAIELKLNGIKP